MSKKILLTGGTGLLGCQLGYEFLKRGDHVIYLARSQRTTRPEERVKKLIDHFNQKCQDLPGTFEIFEGDVARPNLFNNKDLIEKLAGTVDEVWHSAAVLHFRDTYEEINQAININGTVNVLNTAHKLGVKRFHHISTAYVSGTSPGLVMENRKHHEYDFRNPYERTKYNAEHEVHKKSAQYGFDTTIYRPSVIVGDSKSGECLSFTGFYNMAKIMSLIKRVITRGIKNDPKEYRKANIYMEGENLNFPLNFPCAPNSTVNLVPIDYVVNTILKLSDSKKSVGQVYHITNPNPPKIVDLLKEGCKMVQLNGVKFVECPFKESIELVRSEINHYAKMGLNISFCLEIREYIHYLFGEPNFDLSNVRDTLGEKFVEPPIITDDFLRLLITYAIGAQWRGLIQ